MYVSDYGFAASPENWLTNLGLYYNSTNLNDNWLFIGIHEWTISPTTDYSGHAFFVASDGSASGNLVNIVIGVRPTFYLNSDVMFAGGTGTETDPYRIA